MSLIRPRQHAITGLFPHNANRRFVIPKRKQGPIIQDGIAKTVSATLTYDVDIAGGDAVGWTLFNRTTGLPIAVISAVNGNADQIVLNYAAQTLGDFITITYAPGAWTSARGQVNGFKLNRAAVV